MSGRERGQNPEPSVPARDREIHQQAARCVFRIDVPSHPEPDAERGDEDHGIEDRESPGDRFGHASLPARGRGRVGPLTVSDWEAAGNRALVGRVVPFVGYGPSTPPRGSLQAGHDPMDHCVNPSGDPEPADDPAESIDPRPLGPEPPADRERAPGDHDRKGKEVGYPQVLDGNIRFVGSLVEDRLSEHQDDDEAKGEDDRDRADEPWLARDPPPRRAGAAKANRDHEDRHGQEPPHRDVHLLQPILACGVMPVVVLVGITSQRQPHPEPRHEDHGIKDRESPGDRFGHASLSARGDGRVGPHTVSLWEAAGNWSPVVRQTSRLSEIPPIVVGHADDHHGDPEPTDDPAEAVDPTRLGPPPTYERGHDPGQGDRPTHAKRQARTRHTEMIEPEPEPWLLGSEPVWLHHVVEEPIDPGRRKRQRHLDSRLATTDPQRRAGLAQAKHRMGHRKRHKSPRNAFEDQHEIVGRFVDVVGFVPPPTNEGKGDGRRGGQDHAVEDREATGDESRHGPNSLAGTRLARGAVRSSPIVPKRPNVCQPLRRFALDQPRQGRRREFPSPPMGLKPRLGRDIPGLAPWATFRRPYRG